MFSTSNAEVEIGRQRRPRTWTALAVGEAAAAALFLASVAIEPFSLRSERLPLWLGLAAAIFAAYLAVGLWTASVRQRAGGARRNAFPRLDIVLLALFGLGLAIVQLRPDTVGRLQSATSPIQPFSVVAVCLLVLFAALLKLAHATRGMSSGERRRTLQAASHLAVPAAMLALGLLQASVYVLPIGNASLRFWAIADGIFAGNGYPLTLTEPGPISAGSPPYVYDLPLFPLLIRAAFALMGHNSAAVHLPGAIANALFPLALYLLIKQATGSRVTGVLFAALTSLFPFFRIWVLNLPDPDPFFLTSLCFAAYFYLRALSDRNSRALWVVAGVAAGVASLARPEGVLYVGFLGLGILASRPRLRQLTLYVVPLALFVAPMVVVWVTNFGFPWPQNYNNTLDISHPLLTYRQLDTPGGIPLYYKGLGIGAEWGLALLLLFVSWSLLGTLAMAFSSRPLLAIAVPAIGNTATIFFTNPWISNAFHYADFFRHASFGIPFMMVACAYGFQAASRFLLARPAWRVAPYVCLLLLTAAVMREGDILANPTATHRPGSPVSSQVLTDYPYLSLQTILEHPMQLPTMSFSRDRNNMFVGYPTGLPWPESSFQFFKPLDMSYDTQGRAFGYASVAAFLLALAFAVMAERSELSAISRRVSTVSQSSVISHQSAAKGGPDGAAPTEERGGTKLA